MPKNFLDEFNKHLKNFALTERSLWIIDAMREKMSKESTKRDDKTRSYENGEQHIFLSPWKIIWMGQQRF